MPKLNRKLEEIRNLSIIHLWKTHLATVEEIGNIFGLTTSAVYNIIKDSKIINNNQTKKLTPDNPAEGEK